MTPLRISNATRRLAESQDEFTSLSILDERIEGVNYMTSLWEPSPKELEQLAEGGFIRLSIIGEDVGGSQFRPVMITVQPAPSVIEGASDEIG